MSEATSKLFSVGKIAGGFLFCLIISLLIYLSSMMLIFGAWHCPSGNCPKPAWIDITVFLLLASPLLIFSIGAYLCRIAVYELTKSLILRLIILSTFALFPFYLLVGLIANIIITAKK
jgi:hypothetical protein